MKNQLIPPPELAPPSVRHLSAKEKIAICADMVDEADEFLMACLRRRAGPDGDADKAFLEWLERRTAEHDRAALFLMITNLRRRERAYEEKRRFAEGDTDNSPPPSPA